MAPKTMSQARVAALRAAELTYPEVGQTRQLVLPAGYRSFRRSVALRPELPFEAACADLLTWRVQRRSGIGVSASGDVAVGVVVDLRLGFGVLAITAPCRGVFLVSEQNNCGFGYGTLPGHPESGEESFVLSRSRDGAVRFTVSAFSRPATLLSKVARPIGHWMQDQMTARYLRAFD